MDLPFLATELNSDESDPLLHLPLILFSEATISLRWNREVPWILVQEVIASHHNSLNSAKKALLRGKEWTSPGRFQTADCRISCDEAPI